MLTVGLNIVFWNLAYIFCNLRERLVENLLVQIFKFRLSERKAILIAIFALLVAYLITYPWVKLTVLFVPKMLIGFLRFGETYQPLKLTLILKKTSSYKTNETFIGDSDRHYINTKVFFDHINCFSANSKGKTSLCDASGTQLLRIVFVFKQDDTALGTSQKST